MNETLASLDVQLNFAVQRKDCFHSAEPMRARFMSKSTIETILLAKNCWNRLSAYVPMENPISA